VHGSSHKPGAGGIKFMLILFPSTSKILTLLKNVLEAELRDDQSRYNILNILEHVALPADLLQACTVIIHRKCYPNHRSN